MVFGDIDNPKSDLIVSHIADRVIVLCCFTNFVTVEKTRSAVTRLFSSQRVRNHSGYCVLRGFRIDRELEITGGL